MSFFDAMGAVEKEDAEVPNHLRDNNRDSEGFGHGDGYIYPHAYRNHWAAQQYLPTALRGKTFYTPSMVGYEGKIRDDVLSKREIQAAVIMGDTHNAADGEILSWSASSKGREGWFKRLESGRSALLVSDRNLILGQCISARYDRILIPAAHDGLLLWESLRRSPEGLIAGLVDTETAKEALLRYTAALDDVEKPVIAVFSSGKLPSPEEAETLFSCTIFDHILAREPWKRGGGAAAFHGFAQNARKLLTPQGDVAVLQSPPRLGERISRILQDTCNAPQDLCEKLDAAEEAFFTSPQTVSFSIGTETDTAERWTWDKETLETCFQDAGFKTHLSILDQQEERLLTERDITIWFDREKSNWGKFIAAALGDADFLRIRNLLRERITQGPLVWKWKSLLLKASQDTVTGK
jgi:putative ATPase